jgi:RNA polymerase-binding transcription factor
MKANLELVRQALESQLKQTAPTRGLRESIHIYRVADPLDVTQQAAEREVALHSLDRESALARRLRSAIERLNDGSYGVCLECEEEIAPKRLKAIPWAELCIRCQERADRSGAERESLTMSNDLTEAA